LTLCEDLVKFFGNKVSNLRAQFQASGQEISKERSLSSGSAGGTVKEWKYEQVMSFLLPHMQARRLVCL